MSPLEDRVPSVGLHVLYEPEKSDNTLVDVVFVHGLGGHPVRSWQYDDRTIANAQVKAEPFARDRPRGLLVKRSRSSDRTHRPSTRITVTRNNTWHTRPNPSLSAFWPRDLLPLACPVARIITFGYHTVRSGGIPVVAQPDLFSHVNDLLQELGDLRQGIGAQQRPLIFIAHSLGGIIVKELLRQAEFSKARNEQDILSSTAAVIFFGCPHRATEQEPLVDTIFAMAEACLNVKTDSSILSVLCGVDGPRWAEAQESFVRLWHHFNFVTKTYQEGQGDINKLTESRIESSRLGDVRENAECLLADHRTMCRFKSSSDAGFKSLLAILRDVAEVEKCKGRGLDAGETDCLRQLTNHRIKRSHLPITGTSLRTCRRICSTRKFCDWYRRKDGSNENILWLTGSPGSGKSTQLRHVRSQMEKQWKSATALIVYCTAEGDSLGRDTVLEPKLGSMRCVTTIRSILAQLFTQDLGLRERLSSLCDGGIGDTDLTRFFLDDYVASKPVTLARRTFILVDAEDGCDDMYICELLSCLYQLARNSNFSICLASRPVGNDCLAHITRLELENNNSEDMFWSIQSRLGSNWAGESAIVRKIAQKAGGSFLWAQFATNLLNSLVDDGGSRDHAYEVLGKLPKDLHGLFEWVLGRLSSKEKADAMTIMRWVMLSPEPMMLSDLQMAVRLSRTNFLLCRDLHNALDVGLPWSVQELQKKGKQFDTPSQFYQWLCSRTCGLLEARSANDGGAQKSLGLQHIYTINDSVKSFFKSGRGFAVLSSGWATTIPHNHEAIDLCHYSLLRTILVYLNTSDLSPLVSGHHFPEPKQGVLSPEASPVWRKNVADQRNLIMSSYPFLRYAVDNLLYHLLSPRDLRYFLPQQVIFNMFTSHDCRIWRRWTALLGETDALAVLARCKSAESFLQPEFGASFRLARVFRAVSRMATGDSWFSPRKSPRLLVSTVPPIPQKLVGDDGARQKSHVAPSPHSVPIPSRLTRRGPRSRGTVVWSGRK